MNLIKISDVEIPIIEYRGERVITFKMIDQVHKRPEGTAKQNFSYHRKRFQENKHFCHINFTKRSEFHTFGIEIPPRGLTLITERGYLLLVKSLTDDLAWIIQEKLIEGYFRSKQSITLSPDMSFEALTITFQKMADMQRKQIEQDQRLLIIEAKLNQNSSNNDLMTIRSFCNLHVIEIPSGKAKRFGYKASYLSQKFGYPIGRAKDELLGLVNTFHMEILNEIFKKYLHDQHNQHDEKEVVEAWL